MGCTDAQSPPPVYARGLISSMFEMFRCSFSLFEAVHSKCTCVQPSSVLINGGQIPSAAAQPYYPGRAPVTFYKMPAHVLKLGDARVRMAGAAQSAWDPSAISDQ